MSEAEESGLPRACGKLNSRGHSIPTPILGQSPRIPLVTAVRGPERHRDLARASSPLSRGPAPARLGVPFTPHLRSPLPRGSEKQRESATPVEIRVREGSRSRIKATCNPRIPQQLESLNNYGLEICQKAKTT